MDSAEAMPVRRARSPLFARGPSTIVLVMLAIVVAGGAYDPRYLSRANLFLLSRQISFVYLAALGQFLVVLSRGMDLSLGAVAGLAGMVAAWAMQAGVSPPVAVLLALLVGVAVGLVNGVLVAYVRIESFIVTIATGQVVGGMIVGLSRGWSVVRIPRSFLVVAQGAWLGVPIPVWIALLVGVVAHVMLAYTALGRRLFALALNEEATFLSGIDTPRLKLGLYVVSSVAGALTGILGVARLASAQPDTGAFLMMVSLACAVIPLASGMVSALGVALGAALMGEVAYGMTLLRVDPYWQSSAFGIIVVLTFVLDRARRGPA